MSVASVIYIVVIIVSFVGIGMGGDVKLLGLKTTVRTVNRIPTYTSMFISIDVNTGSTSILHHINVLPSLQQPLNFAWTSTKPNPTLYLNQLNGPLLTIVWSSFLHKSATKLPVFSPLLFVWNGTSVYGVMGNSLVLINPANANATVLSTRVYDGPVVQIFGSSSSLYTLSESGLFHYKQGILAWPAQQLSMVSPSEFRITSVGGKARDDQSFYVVFRNTSYPDVRFGWSWGILQLPQAKVTLLHSFTNRDLNGLRPEIPMQGNTAYFLQTSQVGVAPTVTLFDINTFEQGTPVPISDLDSSNFLLDAQLVPFIH